MQTTATANDIDAAASTPLIGAAEEDVATSQENSTANAAHETQDAAAPETNAEGKVLPEGWRKLRAVQMAQQGVFPKEWNLLGVKGKDAFKKKWNSEPKRQVDAICDVLTNPGYATGMGVVTGSFSGGLVAIDLDGWIADEAYKKTAGEAYEPYGEEKTMAWTSGREGRRQLLYRVPEYLLPLFAEIKSLAFAKRGGFLDEGYFNPAFIKDTKLDEEFVIRYNSCMSVLPGSIHPDTKKRYRFLNYNGGLPAEAPQWLIDVMKSKATSGSKVTSGSKFLDEDDLKDIQHETAKTKVPPKQIRGWFFKNEDVRRALMPRLQELVFNHPEFDNYTWVEGSGENPQMQNGCPWHKSSSGTAFQYAKNVGVWDCKACKVSGDELDFIHKIRTGDMYAGRPDPESLETYVSEIAEKLGFKYPEALRETQKAMEAPREEVSSREFLERCRRIIKDFTNPAEQSIELLDLAERCGRFKYKASDIRALVARDNEFQRNKDNTLLRPKNWQTKVAEEEYIIPGFLRKPSQILIHSRGGVGKTESVMALAKAIGRGEVMKIRGIPVQCQKGNVLWISGDQSEIRLNAQLMRMGIESHSTDPWFHLVSDWRIDLPDEFNKIVKAVQPSLIVVDSLGSVSDLGDAGENEGAYAAPLYDISRRNGAVDMEDGFPAAAIIWIHHNKKDGSDFRGTDRLLNAVEETWGLRELTEEEEAEHGVNSRILTIGKSRFDRSGDRLLVTRDHNLNYEIKDLTPTLHRMGVNRNGDLDPAGVVLEVLRAAEQPLKEEEVREKVKEYIQAEGHDKIPKRTAIRKYLHGWIVNGMVRVEQVQGSGGRGQPPKAYSLACAGGGGDRVFIDLDNQDSWPPQVLAFLTRGYENRVSIRNPEGRVSITTLPPEDDLNTDVKLHDLNTDAGCVSIPASVTAMDPEGEPISDADPSAPRVRESGVPVPEVKTWVERDGEETIIPASPEDVRLTDETGEDPWARFD
ncbi:bifunctional DNA primase/polymerase [Cyanobium sp. Lug-B]|uniref:bifunctional DNA primase/polymerase n=1 Tax=Cyanobium sp. Lug-B TaxID=2823716 RepID=UPI0020CD50E2|nr:bifunctional DNA primase/polymerase [Cyanobium sp. Lug-B]MCP9796143.1 bifunctional DNA primase/polymerase [Cyanobium sp. Lug-B]